MKAGRIEFVLFGLVLSGFMSLVVSAVSTVMAQGLAGNVAMLWIRSWLVAWMLAFPVVLLAGPLARKVVQGLLRTARLAAREDGRTP